MKDEESYQKQKEKQVSRTGSMNIAEVCLTGKLCALGDDSLPGLCIGKDLGEPAQEMLSQGNAWAPPALLSQNIPST